MNEEATISALLNDMVVRLQGMPLSTEQKRKALHGVMGALVNVADISMDGNSVSASAAPAQQAALAKEVGTKPANARNYSIYPYARPSLGTSATVVYTNSAGELHMLLIKNRKDMAYGNPAGYINVEPPPAPGEPSTFFAQAQAMHEPQVAAAQAKDWRYVDGLRDATRERLAKAGIAVPADIDLSIKENMARELKEESGIELSQFPSARIQQVHGDMLLLDGRRPYTVAPHFLVDLGVCHTPPVLQPTDTREIEDASWVRVASVTRQGAEYRALRDGDGQSITISPPAIPPIERALNGLLAARIHAASGGLMESARGVAAGLGSWTGKIKVNSGVIQDAAVITAHAPDANGYVPSLLGADGQALMRLYADVAEQLVAAPQAAGERVAGMGR